HAPIRRRFDQELSGGGRSVARRAEARARAAHARDAGDDRRRSENGGSRHRGAASGHCARPEQPSAPLDVGLVVSAERGPAQEDQQRELTMTLRLRVALLTMTCLALSAAAAAAQRDATAGLKLLGARHASADVGVKIFVTSGSLHLIAWDRDSIVVRGHVAPTDRFILFSGKGDSSYKLGVEPRRVDSPAASSDIVINLP